MVAPVLALLAFLVGPPVPVSSIEYVPLGGGPRSPVMAVNGDRALVLWSGGEGAVRLDAEGRALDVPALALPRPQFGSAVDVIADGEGWLVAWAGSDGFGSSMLRLVHVSREGVAGVPRDVPLPHLASGGLLRIARGSTFLAAYSVPEDDVVGRLAVVTIDESGAATAATLDGTLRALTPTASGFALITSDRVVRLSPAGTPVMTIALPDIRLSDAVSFGDDLYVTGVTPPTYAPVVVRIDGATNVAVPFARFAQSATYDAAIDRADGDMLLTWATQGDLAVARLRLDGSVAGPQRLGRQSPSSKWGPGLETAGAACMARRCVLAWTEGYELPTFPWRNLYATTIDEQLRFAPPAIAGWRAVDQNFIGSATSAGVVLVVWRDPWGFLRSSDRRSPLLAARFNVHGQALDAQPMDLGDLGTYFHLVRSTGDGFVVFGEKGQVRIGTEGPPVVDAPLNVLPRDFACSEEHCLAVWEDTTSSLRVSRWRDGKLLDAPGVLVHTSHLSHSGISVLPSGDGFLLGFGRQLAPGAGSIQSIARLRLTESGGWDIRSSDFAASPHGAGGLRLVREGDHVLALWNQGGGVRGSRLTAEGYSTDGGETGWEGWRVAGIDSLYDVITAGSRTFLRSYTGQLYELHGRTAVPISDLPAVGIECPSERRCLAVTMENVTGHPWYRATRLFLRTFAFGRARAVRH